jgi:hypothetical protein
VSGWGRFVCKSGRLTGAPIQDFWTPSRTSVDPPIPNLPLESLPPSDLGGGAVSGATQPVFIEGAQDAIRSKHGALHLFRSVAQAAAAQVTPWFVWLRSKATVAEDEYYRPPKPVDLAAFRAIAAIVTVSSGGALAGTTQPVFVDADKDATRVDHSRLHRFRQASVAAAPQSTPWFIRLKPTRYQDAEDDAKRTDTGLLNAFRGVQVAPLVARVWAIEDPRNRIEEEYYPPRKPVDLALFRNTVPAAPAAVQPFFIRTKPTRYLEETEDVARNTSTLHAFRATQAQPSQPWAMWVRPQYRIDEEVYSTNPQASLHTFRQITIVAEPGQPWFMWPRAVADQTVEPNPVVINHAQLLYAFRPHEAVEVFEPPATPSPHGFEMGGTDDTTKRKRQVPEVSRKPLLQRIIEARAEAAIQQVIAKPAKKNAKKRAQAIEQQAAELAVSGGQESEFFALLEKWLQQTPVYVDSGQKVAENDTSQLFMAQVALKVAAMQELEDERMIISLIQQGII